MRFGAIFGAVARPLLACLPTVAAVVGLRRASAGAALPPLARLGLEVVAGALAYAASAFVVAPATSRDFVELAAGVVRRRRARSSLLTTAAGALRPPTGGRRARRTFVRRRDESGEVGA